MSLARREPLLHARVHDTAAYPGDTAHAHGPIRGFTRFMTVMQLTGSLLGIPIGLASGYAIYRANFAADATCQTLRSNILATLNRSVDAATRRMLVHRDVATFERSCGVSDPDAAAAFKGLLVADKAKAPMIAVTPRVEVKPKDVARKDEPRSIAAAPERRDASDAAWVAAVREALLTEGTQPSAHPAAAKKSVAAAARPMPLDIRAASAAPTTPPVAAPQALAPAMPVAAVPVPDHPVPPGLIPEASPVANAVPLDGRSGSHLAGWVARIPLVGHMIAGQSR